MMYVAHFVPPRPALLAPLTEHTTAGISHHLGQSTWPRRQTSTGRRHLQRQIVKLVGLLV